MGLPPKIFLGSPACYSLQKIFGMLYEHVRQEVFASEKMSPSGNRLSKGMIESIFSSLMMIGVFWPYAEPVFFYLPFSI
jgi:hypothetical protein